MPHDLVTTRQDIVHKDTHGGHDSVILNRYEAPSGPDGEVAFDPFKEYDEWVAAQVMTTLKTHYPGHFWRVVHSCAQGVCLISIPILMGINRYMCVNLKTHAIDSHRVIMAGGEILERYGLLRGRFQLTPFLDAREKHSALVVPSRDVPA